MLFNSYPFLLAFLPGSLLAYRATDAYPPLRIPLLILASLLFYGSWNPEFVPLLAGLIVANWLAARWFVRTGNGRIITAAIILTLTVLGLYKYADFFAATVTALIGLPLGRLNLTLPVGISFLTFHHVMYLADLRRGRAAPTTLDRYALYICFFPQAAAGPLARWSEVGPQYGGSAFGPGWERRCALGITFIVVGLIEKVVLGDPIGVIVNPIYQVADTAPVTDGSAWLALGFGFQIFFDFAGYSDMAIGIALLFGIRLPDNFNAPFRAPSILVFWQRWHMTLSRFLRDYVFLPLADMRVAGTRHTVAQYVLAILATMSLCGLWHGAGWNFVLWGTIQGVAIIVALGWRRYAIRPPRVIGWFLTVLFFLLSAIVFRTGTLGAAWNLYAGLAVAPSPELLRKSLVLGLAIACATLLPASRELCTRITDRPRIIVPIAFGLVCIAMMVQLGSDESYEFIYFKF
jgi:alginate O-acetyltransferase complex protein AlgI